MSNLDFIREHIPRPALWDQLGEELAELIQALYKLRRAEGNGNPTPVTVTEARAAVQEEITDLLNVCHVVGMELDTDDDDTEGEYPTIMFCAGAVFTMIAQEKMLGVPFYIGNILANCKLLGYNIDFDPENPKLARWVERIKEAQNG